MLSNSATVGDETLFAATIILRVLEEIDRKLPLLFSRYFANTAQSSKQTSNPTC